MTNVIFNIGELATAKGKAPLSGKAQGDVSILHDAWVLTDGKLIAEMGQGAIPKADSATDAGGRLVTAGLVDSHTHLVFGGWREHELAQKLAGASYLEILASGGGILSTVNATRAMTEDELYGKSEELMLEMMSYGSTAFEMKSGYGLDLETELSQLRVIKRLKGLNPDIAATYLGAHAVPPEFKGRREAYVDYMVNVVLPEVAKAALAEYCDVFCETGVFTAKDSERILLAAQRLGMGLKIHSDEIDEIGGTALAGKLHAASAEHLAVTGAEGVSALKAGGVIACLLPATSFYLGKGYANGRAMIGGGVPVAIASDFNPGSTPNSSLQFAMHAGCYRMRLTPKETLTAVTLNAACCMGKGETLGSIEAGKNADLVVWDAPNLDHLMYRYGTNRVQTVVKAGKIIYNKERINV
ncbi:MAG TPA: imidazolonepropionase [Clostridia bacterium]|nr:imidazolonepropionase [Clostridia bacterium]